MSESRIADLVRKEAQSFGSNLDGTPGPSGWQRIDCPFCHLPRAQIHHERGLYWCPHSKCAKRLAISGDWSIVRQFEETITKVVGCHAVAKYGVWLDKREAREFCEHRLVERSRDGWIDEREADCDGEPDRMRAYVFTDLRGDLLNYADAKKRRKDSRRHDLMEEATSLYDETDEPTEATPVAGGFGEYPLLAMKYIDGMAQSEIAEELDCSVRTVIRRMAEERELLTARGIDLGILSQN